MLSVLQMFGTSATYDVFIGIIEKYFNYFIAFNVYTIESKVIKDWLRFALKASEAPINASDLKF